MPFTTFSLSLVHSIGYSACLESGAMHRVPRRCSRQHFRAWLVDWVCTFSTAAQRSTTTMIIPAQDRSDIALREAEIDNHRLTALILLFTHVFQPGPSATG